MLAELTARQRQPHLARLSRQQLAQILLQPFLHAAGEDERLIELHVDQHPSDGLRSVVSHDDVKRRRSTDGALSLSADIKTQHRIVRSGDRFKTQARPRRLALGIAPWPALTSLRNNLRWRQDVHILFGSGIVARLRRHRTIRRHRLETNLWLLRRIGRSGPHIGDVDFIRETRPSLALRIESGNRHGLADLCWLGS